MLMRDFNNYCEGNVGTKKEFYEFLEDIHGRKEIKEWIKILSWEIYQLQICVEGLIEDQEFQE